MRIYFLVEGRRTEPKVYASWLFHLLPELKRMPHPDEASADGYFLLSAEGYPSIIYDLIPDSIEDVNRIGNYNYLVVSLDADEVSIQERINEIDKFLVNERLMLHRATLVIIVQNRCIETWFLGNRHVVNRRPRNTKLQEYLQFYDVRLNDPELMGIHPDFGTHSQFHLQYLREVFSERSIVYSKRRPGHVLEKSYLEQLLSRIEDAPNDLSSFQIFMQLCQQVKNEIINGH